jgi:hypothetical protein
VKPGWETPAALVAAALIAITGVVDVQAASAQATAAANAPASPVHASPGANRAPSSPPLTSGETGAPTDEGTSAAMSSGGDPLVSNGLGSPMCRAAVGEAALSRTSESNCRTSGFEAAPAPTGNYAFDIHINTGVTKLDNDVAATFQNLLQLAWTVLVAAVHGVVVMIEWCYTIDLLGSSAMGGVATGLRETQATFTQPWLVVVLAVASILAAYHGLVRRRVAETVGQALLMLAMMAGGLWVIMDPAGTVGSLAQWANQAGLGALGAVAAGTPNHSNRTLADSMGSVFSGAVAGPWCYMEFGNVAWCSDPRQLDARLRAAGVAAAASVRAQIGCKPAGTCAQSPGGQAGLGQGVERLLHARTNGELFLALPANEAIRNSINDPGSLFNVLCGGSETPCRGPTAAEAEFRTEHGTAWRFMGLVFIWVGVLGMLLLLGFIGMRLLGAAIASLLYLLLAPSPARRSDVEAHLLVRTRRRAADGADPDVRSDGAWLVHTVAAHLDHVVGRVPPASPAPRLGPQRPPTAARATVSCTALEWRAGDAEHDSPVGRVGQGQVLRAGPERGRSPRSRGFRS